MSKPKELRNPFTKAKTPGSAVASPNLPTALVVESNEVVKLCIANLLEMAGFAVLQATSADEALDNLERRSDIGLMVTNVIMQGEMDGVELVYAALQTWPTLKVMVVSGKRGLSESDLPAKCRFLAKPYSDEELIFEIHSLLNP